MKKLFISFAFFFLLPFSIASAAELSVAISPSGDVPTVSVGCQPDHNYTLVLTHRTEDIVNYSLGGVERRPCVNGSVSFTAFNINNILTSRTGVSDWWNWVRTPLEYIIKDTTGIYSCDENFCLVINLEGAFNNYDKSVYLASSTVWTTLASGPVFYTTDHGATWANTDVPPPPPPPEPTCQSDCFSNVLFLPGLEASRLYNLRADGSEDQLWEPNGNSDVEDLYMNPDGTSKDASVYTRDIIGETNVPFWMGPGGQNIYKSFQATMNGLVTDGKIAEWKAFPYDWRTSLEDVVSKPVNLGNGQTADLVSTLKNLIASSKSGKVTIIAHSNGGLLAKALLVKLQEMKTANPSDDMIDHVDMLVLVASPQIGTASAVSAMLHGYDQEILAGILINEQHARELGRNMPGAYGLLPTREYINRMSTSPVVFTDNTLASGVTTPFVNSYGKVIDSYAEYKNFLFGAEGRVDPAVSDKISPIKLSSALFAGAESLHNKIDTWTPPTGLRVIEVAGWGLDTVASFEYYPKYECTTPDSGTGTCGYVLDERPIFTSDGDKTVVEPSAMYMNGVEKYWININQYNRSVIVKRQHKDILEVQQLEQFLFSIIKKETPVYDLVMTATKPTDTTNRLRISIHSPVTIGTYDKNGNFTGTICPPTSDFCYKQEDIPNSSYLEFGEGKYINLPEDSLQKVVLQGTDIGTFTYQSARVLPDGRSATTTFADIPVTTQTVAEVTLNGAQNPQLTLDITGDGTPDFTVQPSTTLDPILFLQIMKKTIESFDVSKQTKNNLLKKIDDTIKAIEKGKITKAKLKLEQFKKALAVHSKETKKEKEEREKKNEKERQKERKENKKPKQLDPADVQTLITLLNQLLDNLNK